MFLSQLQLDLPSPQTNVRHLLGMQVYIGGASVLNLSGTDTSPKCSPMATECLQVW